VVHLVQDHQGAAGQRTPAVDGRVHADLGVRQDDAVEVGGGVDVGVAERRVERDADPRRGLRPLGLEVLRGRHHGDRLDGAVGQQLGRDPQGEGGLPRARGGDRQEVLVAAA